MKDVSALMDGELDRRRADATIERVENQDELRDAWSTFHVIRETLRGEPIRPGRFSERFHDRLMQEQTVVVPTWKRLLRGRWLLPVIVGALVVAGAVATFLAMGRSAPPGAPAPPATGFSLPATGEPDLGVYGDYLAAHRPFLPPARPPGAR